MPYWSAKLGQQHAHAIFIHEEYKFEHNFFIKRSNVICISMFKEIFVWYSLWIFFFYNQLQPSDMINITISICKWRFFILCKLVENNWEIGDTLKQGFFFVAFNICSLTAEIFPSLVHIKWCLKLAVDICWWVYSMQVQAEVLCWHFWILLKEILWCWELGLGHTDVYVEGRLKVQL